MDEISCFSQSGKTTGEEKMDEISCFSQSSKTLEFTPCPLPLDILINHVFVELPVRSLAHCRCVCKQWLRALSEPEFTRLHHKRQFQKPHNRKIICGPMQYRTFGYKDDRDKKQEAFSGVFYSLDIQSSSHDVVAAHLPGFRGIYYCVHSMLGYSNGMVCMETCKKGMGDSNTRHLLFGNPSTGVYNLLPDPITGCLFCGFGFDSSSDDYKFVRVVDGITHIFSLKSNSWRNIGHSPFEIVNDMNEGCFLDGSIYWLLKGSNRILGFDLKDELFLELPPLPSWLLLRSIFISRMSMKVLGGSVCIIDISCPCNAVVMWSLFNEGETYLWKELMKVTLGEATFYVDPVCFTEDGNILCFVKRGLDETCYILVDPKTKKIQDFTIPKLSEKSVKGYASEAHLSGYIDTLVTP